MDKITETLLKRFETDHQITEDEEDVRFEIFAGYCVARNLYGEPFEPTSLSTGGKNDCGIDGFAIIADDELITNMSELQTIYENRKRISELKFIFIQAKRSDKFSSGEIAKFCMGVVNSFKNESVLETNERIDEIRSMIKYVIENSNKIRQNPDCLLYYITTGTWNNDKAPKARFDQTKSELDNLNIFENVEIHPWGAKDLQKAYRNIIEANSCEVEIKQNITLPTTKDITESYLGFIEINEYLKLITSDSSNIKKSVFYSNVRDYQGDTDVNLEISKTICTTPSKFLFFNNGVTIICKSIKRTSDRFTLTDYQIVNGCQTSHEIFKNRTEEINDVKIVIKLIVTEDEATINNIIRATNSQTKIPDGQFIALGEFHKELEDFYATYPQNHRLFYERRHLQYEYQDNVEKVRIVTIAGQIKAFSSMFLKLPHLACGYYGLLIKNVKKKIFKSSHKKEAYYTCAYLLYKLEYAFRNRLLERKYRPFRYHILSLFKEDYITESLESKKIINECSNLLKIAKDNTAFVRQCKLYIDVIERCLLTKTEGDITKQASFISTLINEHRGTN